MTRFRRLSAPVALGSLFVSVAILTACSGKGVTIGSSADELRSVDPSTVTGTVPSCSTSQAHPNVCCKGGPSESSACVAYVNSPFHQCDDGWTLYPNPTSCCDLSDPTNCGAPPPNPPAPPPGSTCGYACAPGWWPVVNDPGQCCQLIAGEAALQCTQVAWAGGSGGGTTSVGCAEPDPTTGSGAGGGGPEIDASPGEPIDGGPNSGDGGVVTLDAGPVPPQDGGVITVPPYCDAGVISTPPTPAPPWPTPICNVPCPPGFAALSTDPSTCCQVVPVAANGAASGGDNSGNGGGGAAPPICFSLAGGPAVPVSTPGSGSGSTSGSTGSGSSAGGSSTGNSSSTGPQK